ncbi:MAG: hypothetical protein WHU10_00185 [Fimbriimonadales bacterium]
MSDNRNNHDSLDDLLRLARALRLDSCTLSLWLQAMAKPSGRSLALFCSQLAPANRSGDAPSQDALGWADGNPNGFGYQRALDALRHWGAAWPGGDAPATAHRFYRELLLGQACALFLGVNPLPIGMAPAIRGDDVYVLRYAADGVTSWAAYDRDAHAFHAAWDYGRYGSDPLRAQTTGLPSLASAQLALDIMLGHGQGAGWVAGASR